MNGVEEKKIEMDVEEKRSLEKKKKKQKLISWGALLVMLILVALIVKPNGFNAKQEKEDTLDFSGVNKICELSTLRCYYHNVAELKKDPDGVFQYGWFKYGFKKLWMEYAGIIEVGIDVNQVLIEEPNENNEVYVYVPDARIMKVSADTTSMKEPISDTGIFTKITAEDQNQAFTQAQGDMKDEASNDTTILNRAKNNAKKLLEEYIVNMGKQVGKDLKVKWLDEPKGVKGDE